MKLFVALVVVLSTIFAVKIAFMIASPDTRGTAKSSSVPELPSLKEFQPYITSLIGRGLLRPDCLVYVVPGCSSCTMLPDPSKCGPAMHCYVIMGDYPMSKTTGQEGKLIVDAKKTLLPRRAYVGPEIVLRIRSGKVKMALHRSLRNFMEMEAKPS